MSHTNMKRVELKRIVEFLWKGSPADEKTPFAIQGTVPDNGSFSKNLEADDNKKAAKEFPEDEGGRVEGPMSIPRKLCFAMSFNLWILYFLVLGWLLPCGHRDCGLLSPQNVKRSLSTIWPSTDIEAMNQKGLPSLAMLGYEDGLEMKLSALATYDATFEWNNSLPFIPRTVKCNFENTFDANGDGIQDCLLTGFSDVYAFNATDGHVFWHQRLDSSDEGNIMKGGFHPTAAYDNGAYLIGVYADKLVVLSASTGNQTMETNLPCAEYVEVRVVPNSIISNFTLWKVLCNYGDQVEAWGFREEDVLNGGNLENNATPAFEFALLFRGTNSDGSIGFGGDVTPVPGGPFLLSWSDRVSMVTREATAWERRFPYPLTVVCLAVGNFSLKENQAAAAVLNGTDTIVFVLSLNNGSIVSSVTLPDTQAQSMDLVPGDRDLLLLKSRIFGEPTIQTNNFSDPIPTGQTNFATIDFRNTPVKITNIATESTVRSSTLNKQINGEIDLLVIKTENANTTYQKYVIHGSDALYSLCRVKDVLHNSIES